MPLPLIPNVAKGIAKYYLTRPAPAGIVAVLFQTTGLGSDEVLTDSDTLDGLLAGTTNEATFTGYARQPVVPSVVVSDANNNVNANAPDIEFDSTELQAIGAIGFYFKPNTTIDDDTAMIPLFFDTIGRNTPANGTLTYRIAGTGFWQAN